MKDLKRGIRRDHRDRLKKKRKYYWGMNKWREATPKLLNHVVDYPQHCSCSQCCNNRRNRYAKKKEKLTIQERKFLESLKIEEVCNEYFPNED